MQTEEGGQPSGYAIRRIYQSDMMNPYNGPYDSRKTISAENDILYGKSKIEVGENRRTRMAEMHGQTDPNRGRAETWYNQLSSTIQPRQTISTALLNKTDEEATIRAPDRINSLVALRPKRAAAYGDSIEPKLFPSRNRMTSAIGGNPPSRISDLSHQFFTAEYGDLLAGGMCKVVSEPVTSNCCVSGDSKLCLSFPTCP